jgi:enoyl-CoA hydratase
MKYVGYEEDGPVVVITFDRPERMNAIGREMGDSLCEAWDRFRGDDDARVAVLTGRGTDAFCAGGDLKSLGEGEAPPIPITPEERAEHVRGHAHGCLGPSRWTDIAKPTIAAVNGVAYAGGLEWACFPDIAIADAHATFGVTCRRWNIGLADGGTVRLPRIVGYRRAMELIITGRVIDAQEAHEIGLVNEVVPSGRALPRAVELAHRIASLPQPAILTDKESVVRGFDRPIDEALRIEAECFDRLIGGAEMAEGVRQFTERDHPDRRPDGDPLTAGIARPRSGG